MTAFSLTSVTLAVFRVPPVYRCLKKGGRIVETASTFLSTGGFSTNSGGVISLGNERNQIQAWNKNALLNEQKMFDVEPYGWKVADLNDLKNRDFAIMQFTGLHDENGKEIYEGDMVGEEGFYFPVTWSDGAFHIGNSQTLIEWIHARSRRGIPTEVIGNMYENPELVK